MGALWAIKLHLRTIDMSNYSTLCPNCGKRVEGKDVQLRVESASSVLPTPLEMAEAEWQCPHCLLWFKEGKEVTDE